MFKKDYIPIIGGALAFLILVTLILFVAIEYAKSSSDAMTHELEHEISTGSAQIKSHFVQLHSDLLRIEHHLANTNMNIDDELYTLLAFVRCRDPNAIAEILILDADGTVIASTDPKSIELSFRETEYLENTQQIPNIVHLSETITVSDFTDSAESASETLDDPLDLGWALYSGVYSKSIYKGSVLFVLRSEPLFNQYSSAIARLPSRSGFILQDNGILLFHRDVELRGKNISDLPDNDDLALVKELLNKENTEVIGRGFLGEKIVSTSVLCLEDQCWTLGILTTTPELTRETVVIIYTLSGVVLLLWLIIVNLVLALKRLGRAQKSLTESEERFRALFEGAPDAIFLADPETGKILDANPSASKLLLRPHEEIVGLHQSQLHPKQIEEYSTATFHQHTQQDDGKFLSEITVSRSDGSSVPVEILAQTLQIKGKPVLQGVFRDITARKRAEDELERSRAQLRDLSQHLLTALEEERTYVAREIHDEFGQALTALKMDTSWIAKQLPDLKPDLKEKIASMSTMIDNTIRIVRRIATDLRPGMLDDLGLVPALEWQTTDFQERAEVDCELNLPEEVHHLSRDQSTAIFRIFQETLTNIARHAQATRIWIQLQDDIDELRLIVRDNGSGITEAAVLDQKSLGLIGMRERIQQWGGDIDIHGDPDEGTTVTMRLPRTKIRGEA